MTNVTFDCSFGKKGVRPVKYLTIVFLVYCISSGAVSWPPDTSYCSKCHRDSVLTVPGCPSNTEVRVSQNSGGGAISFSTFLGEVGAHVNIGTYGGLIVQHFHGDALGE